MSHVYCVAYNCALRGGVYATPFLSLLNGIVFRQQWGLGWRWRHHGVPKPAQNIPSQLYAVAGLTVEQFSIASLRIYNRNAVQTLHYSACTTHYITLRTCNSPWLHFSGLACLGLAVFSSGQTKAWLRSAFGLLPEEPR